jgi:hypothetical protein
MGLREDHGPAQFFSNDVWFRGIVDFLKIKFLSETSAIALAADWKAGKPKSDSEQLALFAAMIFAHYPYVIAVRTSFIWLNEGFEESETWTPKDMPDLWGALDNDLAELKHAFVTGEYAKKPGRLCKKWCPVTDCEHCGR